MRRAEDSTPSELAMTTPTAPRIRRTTPTPRRTRGSAARRGFDLERERDLVRGEERERLVAPQIQIGAATASTSALRELAGYSSWRAGTCARRALRPPSRPRPPDRASRPTRSPAGGRGAAVRPTPSTSATASDSTSPSKTFTSVTQRTGSRCALDLLAGPAPSRRPANATSPAAVSRRGPPDGQLPDPQRRLPGRHRHPLAVLAARAGPGVEVATDRVDAEQRLGTVADELRGRPDR